MRDNICITNISLVYLLKTRTNETRIFAIFRFVNALNYSFFCLSTEWNWFADFFPSLLSKHVCIIDKMKKINRDMFIIDKILNILWFWCCSKAFLWDTFLRTKDDNAYILHIKLISPFFFLLSQSCQCSQSSINSLFFKILIWNFAWR